MVPEALQKKVLSTKQAIIDNKITFESCQEGGKETRCVKAAST